MKKFYLNRRWISVILALVTMVTGLWINPVKVQGGESEYYIYVNITKNVVTAYKDGEPVRAMICSSGAATHESGTFSIPNKYRWHMLNGGVCGQYCSRISSHILFHSVPLYGWQNPGSLKPSYYDKLGTKASAGCIRLNVSDAKWIYENCPVGTKVTFYKDSENPGPLGQPFFSKIGSFPKPLCNWDPTDPAENSPWNVYAGEAFDAEYYLENNPDLKEMGYYWTEDSLRHHWFTNGIKEGRQASAKFSFEEFKRQRPDLYAKYGEDNNYAYVEAFNTGKVSALTDSMGQRKMQGSAK